MSTGRTTIRPGCALSLLSVLTTNQKGAIAEAAIVKAALDVGYDVYRPMFEGGRYDLILDTGDRLLARPVQVGADPRRGFGHPLVQSQAYVPTAFFAGGYVAGEFDALGRVFAGSRPVLPHSVRGDRRRTRGHASPCADAKQPAARSPTGERFRIRRYTSADLARAHSSAGRALALAALEVAGSSPAGSTSRPPTRRPFSNSHPRERRRRHPCGRFLQRRSRDHSFGIN